MGLDDGGILTFHDWRDLKGVCSTKSGTSHRGVDDVTVGRNIPLSKPSAC